MNINSHLDGHVSITVEPVGPYGDPWLCLDGYWRSDPDAPAVKIVVDAYGYLSIKAEGRKKAVCIDKELLTVLSSLEALLDDFEESLAAGACPDVQSVLAMATARNAAFGRFVVLRAA
ncbi:hypothetical protein C7I87_00545 [Mesorhizobium sp. SARCC-RB16n]|uniref:hypothetical protein n=1 Tax=Mesorhizobium sp. SARCC-RB16n TaxID=2116687 RepID=UPI00122F83E9|nr:hypothetical protein [Mesorhizobium sp. SARCC-RB16n]KAA3452701.1 hypothetical protein C7I87_00545 [Mesorhizobium sp. SARCC-RB16n]